MDPRPPELGVRARRAAVASAACGLWLCVFLSAGATLSGGRVLGPERGVSRLPGFSDELRVAGTGRVSFSAVVHPDGRATTALFQFGLAPRYREPRPPGPVYDESTPPVHLAAGLATASVSGSVSGLVPDAVYSLRLVARSSAGTVDSPGTTFTTAADPAPPLPVIGATVNLEPVSGLVLTRPPSSGSSRVPEARRLIEAEGFLPLTETRRLSIDSEVDARAGTLSMVVAGAHRGLTQRATITGAIFSLAQVRQGSSLGLTTLTLLDAGTPSAPASTGCPAHSSARAASGGRPLADSSPRCRRCCACAIRTGASVSAAATVRQPAAAVRRGRRSTAAAERSHRAARNDRGLRSATGDPDRSARQTAVPRRSPLTAFPARPPCRRGPVARVERPFDLPIVAARPSTLRPRRIAYIPVADQLRSGPEAQGEILMPTLTNVDHVGVVVPDLEKATRFFVDIVGGELLLRYPPFPGTDRPDGGPNWIADDMGLPRDAVLECALVRLGPALTLELYAIPYQDQRAMNRHHDLGAPHIAFRVTDIEAAIAYLKAEGLTVFSGPTEESGDLEGVRWVHFETPWGLKLELDQAPAELPFEQTTGVRWTPAFREWDNRWRPSP